jgi:hypothetical protein
MDLGGAVVNGARQVSIRIELLFRRVEVVIRLRLLEADTRVSVGHGLDSWNSIHAAKTMAWM